MILLYLSGNKQSQSYFWSCICTRISILNLKLIVLFSVLGLALGFGDNAKAAVILLVVTTLYSYIPITESVERERKKKELARDGAAILIAVFSTIGAVASSAL